MLKEIPPGEWMVEESQRVKDAWPEFDGILERVAEDPNDTIESLQKLIQKCPEHIDAIHHLGMMHYECGGFLEARLLAKHGVDQVLSNLPSDVDLSQVRLSWMMLENRPFLRALHAYGVYLLESDEYVMDCQCDSTFFGWQYRVR